MRRISAITLLFLITLPVLSPLTLLGDNEDLSVPVCCRRHGGKRCHCAMMMAYLASRLPGQHVQAPPTPCPDCPGTVPVTAHFHLGLSSAGTFFAEIASHPAVHVQTEARARVSLDRAWRKRGPPESLLS